MTTVLNTPYSEKVILAANAVAILPGSIGATQFQIPNGATCTVATTLATSVDIAAGNAEWTTWSDGAKAGPFIKELPPCTAIRVTNSAAAGYINLMQ